MKNGNPLVGYFILTVLAIFLTSWDSANSLSRDVKPFHVIIDVSHGGKDNGVVNTAFNLREKELILSICKKLKKQGRSSKINYILTRKKDVYMSLNQRIEFVNRLGADLLLSVHLNESGNDDVSGPEAHYYDLGEGSMESQAFCELLKESYSIHNSEVMIHATEFRILKETKCPSVLFHLGYITSAADVTFLDSTTGQLDIADQLDRAIVAFRDR